MFPETLIEGKSEPLTPCAFTAPDGKVFAGWNTAKDGSGTKYADEAEITLKSDITLYAQWKDSAVTLSALCFTAEEAGATVKMSVVGTLAKTPVLEYSTDGITWTSYVIGTDITLANVGDKVYLQGNNDSFSEGDSNYVKFEMTGKIAASGNVMSLLDKDCLMDTLYENALTKLFFECSSLTTAPALPATMLESWCYQMMFNGCTSLNKIKVSFTSWDGSYVTSDWLKNVSSTGEFTCPSTLHSAGTMTGGSSSTIPDGWTVVNP